MNQYSEKELQEALDYIANGTPIKQAAREYGIPRSTLQNRLKGQHSRSEGAADLQRLSPNQEKHFAENRSIRKKQPGSKAWTSFIECVSAQGHALPPLVIFKGKTVQQWFPLDLSPFKGWQFTATENGWITDETAVE
ncbi:hypothetical protein PG994_014346 [Apiospora phragmitis]|uniref:HTH psq-type domain-containing protein n=1 Tax=Apiospora phragmitis TaxID=2905665 RepID=A0ABR1T438_9PEZI